MDVVGVAEHGEAPHLRVVAVDVLEQPRGVEGAWDLGRGRGRSRPVDGRAPRQGDHREDHGSPGQNGPRPALGARGQHPREPIDPGRHDQRRERVERRVVPHQLGAGERDHHELAHGDGTGEQREPTNRAFDRHQKRQRQQEQPGQEAAPGEALEVEPRRVQVVLDRDHHAAELGRAHRRQVAGSRSLAHDVPGEHRDQGRRSGEPRRPTGEGSAPPPEDHRAEHESRHHQQGRHALGQQGERERAGAEPQATVVASGAALEPSVKRKHCCRQPQDQHGVSVAGARDVVTDEPRASGEHEGRNGTQPRATQSTGAGPRKQERCGNRGQGRGHPQGELARTEDGDARHQSPVLQRGLEVGAVGHAADCGDDRVTALEHLERAEREARLVPALDRERAEVAQDRHRDRRREQRPHDEPGPAARLRHRSSRERWESSLACRSQSRPSNGVTRMSAIVSGSRQRTLTLNPSGFERGT